MALELSTPRPSSSSSKDLSSVECFSTHSGQEREASSRLAARLERSEFKRSRGKQRLSQRSNPSAQSKHTRERGTTSANRRDHHELSGRSSRNPPSAPPARHPEEHESSSHSRSRPFSWCEPTRNEQVADERPRSFHGGDLEAERVTFLSHNPHRLSAAPHSRGSYRLVNDYLEVHGETSGDVADSKAEQFLERSRSSSFSSHIGSSADEQDDSHGVYSAYDMSGRSPYGSALSRRYSQSSLSSSSASWQPSSASLSHQFVKAFKESGTRLSSPPDESCEAYFSPQGLALDQSDTAIYVGRAAPQDSSGNAQQPVFTSRFTVHADENKKRRHVQDQRKADKNSQVYSSRPVSTLEKSSAESTLGATVTLRSKDDRQLSGVSRTPSVKDLAKRFSGNFSSLEAPQDGFTRSDPRIVKAETWPKVAYLPANSDQQSGDDDSEIVPPKPPYPHTLFEHAPPRGSDEGAPPKPPLPSKSSEWGLPTAPARPIHYPDRKLSDPRESKVVASVEMFVNAKPERKTSLGSRDASRSECSSYGELKNSDVMVSQLIKLHEDRIASHAKSAFAASHLQIHLKRPGPEWVPLWKGEAECAPDSLQIAPDQAWQVYPYADEVENGNGVTRANEAFTGPVEPTRTACYELLTQHDHRVDPVEDADVPDKNHQIQERQTIKERPRVKRHRTIGVVGYRQQADRTAETKPKRHTAIGIVTAGNWAQNVDPAADSGLEEHIGEGPFEAVPSPLERGIHDKDSESFEDSVFVDPAERDHKRGARLFPNNFDRVECSFHVDGETEQSVPLGVSSQDVGPDRVEDSEQVVEPTIAVFVKATKEEEPQPKTDVDAKASKGVSRKESRKPRLDFSSRTYHHSKTVPVAQVSPVSPSPSGDRKTTQVVSPLQTNHSAREMYETRLALWNLIPSSPAQQNYEVQSPEAVCTDSSAKQTPELTATNASEVDAKPRPSVVHNGDAFDAQRQEPYEDVIERLKREKQEVIEKHESDKREWKRKYEEQKKVANAYQKLEDRYRRRVHELQEALANCTCQNSFPMEDSTRNKNDEEAKSAISNVRSLLIAKELQVRPGERSKNKKPTKGTNAASGDSLPSSSSDATGLAWDEVYDTMLRNGEFDHVNGTDV